MRDMRKYDFTDCNAKQYFNLIVEHIIQSVFGHTGSHLPPPLSLRMSSSLTILNLSSSHFIQLSGEQNNKESAGDFLKYFTSAFVREQLQTPYGMSTIKIEPHFFIHYYCRCVLKLPFQHLLCLWMPPKELDQTDFLKIRQNLLVRSPQIGPSQFILKQELWRL